MRNLLILLTSTIALTLARAAVTSERSQACTPQPQRGVLSLMYSDSGTQRYEYSAGRFEHVGFGESFRSTTQWPIFGTIAEFYFYGCQGGAPFHLYCTNCGSPTGYDILATRNMGFEYNGEPDNWLFYNYANARPSDALAGTLGEHNATVNQDFQSLLFTWDLDGTFIRPVTYNLDYSVQPLLFAIEGWGGYVFTPNAAHTRMTYAFWWNGPNN